MMSQVTSLNLDTPTHASNCPAKLENAGCYWLGPTVPASAFPSVFSTPTKPGCGDLFLVLLYSLRMREFTLVST